MACYFCGKRKGAWKYLEDPRADHEGNQVEACKDCWEKYRIIMERANAELEADSGLHTLE